MYATGTYFLCTAFKQTGRTFGCIPGNVHRIRTHGGWCSERTGLGDQVISSPCAVAVSPSPAPGTMKAAVLCHGIKGT
jgi:hypothetical protein